MWLFLNFLYGKGLIELLLQFKNQRPLDPRRTRLIIRQFILQSFVLVATIVGSLPMFFLQKGDLFGVLSTFVVIFGVTVVSHYQISHLNKKFADINNHYRTHTSEKQDIHVVLKREMDDISRLSLAAVLLIVMLLLLISKEKIAELVIDYVIMFVVVYVCVLIERYTGSRHKCRMRVLDEIGLEQEPEEGEEAEAIAVMRSQDLFGRWIRTWF